MATPVNINIKEFRGAGNVLLLFLLTARADRKPGPRGLGSLINAAYNADVFMGVRAGSLSLLVGLCAASVQTQTYEQSLDPESSAIRYWDADSTDASAKLGLSLADGFEPIGNGEHFELTRLLAALDISVASQLLVFSKTSLQRATISPETPRAIYFNDELAVGHVPGSTVIELAVSHPTDGARFYSFDTRSRRLERPRVCLECHLGPATLGVPGMYVGSVNTSPSGRPVYDSSAVTDLSTGFDERWAGWYVTGAPPGFRHGGNAVNRDPTDPGLHTEGPNPDVALERLIDLSGYPSRSSDMVALMVLEHQTAVQNQLTRLHWELRLSPEGEHYPGVDARLDTLVASLVFEEEATLVIPMAGLSAFARMFGEKGPHDTEGRSLRRLNLTSRLFEYPLSYLVYSPGIERLPSSVRVDLYARILRALDRQQDANRISAANHQAAVEIARQTIAQLSTSWQP